MDSGKSGCPGCKWVQLGAVFGGDCFNDDLQICCRCGKYLFDVSDVRKKLKNPKLEVDKIWRSATNGNFELVV